MQSLPPDFGATQAPTGPEDPGARRACDQCRLRKIRCDKEWPCSNCRTASRICSSTGAGQRPKEARQRVLISSQYERKIDQIESRLGSIENLLKDLSANRPQPSDSSRFPQSQVHTPATGSSSAIPATSTVADECDSGDEELEYGGNSGFTTQTTFASDFIEHAIRRTSLHDSNPGIEAALANLRQLVKVQRRRPLGHGPRFPFQKPLPPGGVTSLPMPPMDVVVPLLRQTKSPRLSMSTITCALVGISDFTALCRLVYFPAEDVSPALFGIVNAGLFNLLMEESLTADSDPSRREELRSHALVAQANLETYLANLPLFQSPRIENIQALLLGSSYAIDVCRPSVAWHLNTTAVELCQAGGFHRAEGVRSDPPRVAQIKSILFWQAYLWDRGLGLRLGRAPVIQDCDITIAREPDFSGFPHLEQTSLPRLWLRASELQGHIYSELYSPVALKEPQAEISRRAHHLAETCRALEPTVSGTYEESTSYLSSNSSSVLIDVLVSGDEVHFLTLATLVYRALPAPEGSPSRFCSECLNVARRAVMAHKNSLNSLSADGDTYVKSLYVHWNLMLTPFAPFFVLFCHIIETLSVDDLEMVKDFVVSMERLRDTSEAIEKLYRVFQVYCEVAVAYVEAKPQQREDHSMIPIGDEFDMYLSQLGFMPADSGHHATNQGGQVLPDNPMVDGSGGAQASEMTGWYSGSRNLFGLLEEDLSGMDGARWMATGPS